MARVALTPMAAFLVAAALASTLAGCTLTINTPSSSSSTEPSAVDETPSSSPSAEPDAEPVALTIPGCNDLITLDQVRSALGAPTAVLHEETSPAREYSPPYGGPVFRSTVPSLTVSHFCFWGVPNSDSGFYVLVAEIDSATRSSIQTEMTSEGFSSAVVGTRTIFSKGVPGDYVGETDQFVGDLWIHSNAASLDISGVTADFAYEAMRAANPTLGL